MYLHKFAANRLPGISHGFSFTAQPGLNLLTGPNGSGKSSTARALAYLLWPTRQPAAEGLEAQAWFRLQDDRELSVAVTASAVMWTQAGATIPAPELPSAHLAACYHLDVLDLIQPAMAGDDTELTRSLAKELSGGIDKGRLRDQLFSLSGLAVNRKVSNLISAKKAVQQLRRRQESLAEQQASLAARKEEWEQAVLAGRRAEILEAIVSLDALRSQLVQCESDFDELPAGAGLIRPEDPGRLRDLQQNLNAKQTLRADYQQKLEEIRSQLEVIPPPPAQGATTAIAELESRIEVLLTAHTQLEETRRSLAQSLASAQRTSGTGTTGSSTGTTLDRPTFKRIMEAWGSYWDHQVKVQAQRALLEQPRPVGRAATPNVWLGAGCGLLGGAVITFLKSPDVFVAYGLGILGLMFLGIAWLRRKPKAQAVTIVSDAALREQESLAEQAKSTMLQLLKDAGLDLDLSDLSGPLLLHQIRAHLEHQEELARRQDAAATSEQRWTQTLDKVNELLESWQQTPARDMSSARATVIGLKEAWSQRQTLQDKTKATELEIHHLADDLTRLQREITRIFLTLKLDADTATDRDLEHLLEIQPRYKALDEKRSSLRQSIAGFEHTIATNRELFADSDPTAFSATELNQRIALEKQRAQSSHQISMDIGALEKEITMAMQGHELEQALAQVDSAENVLRSARQRELEAGLGNLLLDDVMNEYQTTIRPEALDQADDILGKITKCSYKLSSVIDDQGNPVLVIHDENLGRDLSPAQLSTGTRTQLFLSLRLGFLATQTAAEQPPVILDDILTTSDPARFTAAVKSLGLLAAEHNLQIFYLCSRPDEVEAWQQTLAAESLPPAHVIDLAALRQLAAAAPARILTAWNQDQADALLPPDPHGLTAAEYAVRIQVPRPRTWDAPGNLHLFYLLADDLPLLHKLLVAGITTVGHWRTHGGTLTSPGLITPEEMQKLEAVITTWEQFLKLWRTGRPPLVTAEWLQNSSAVTSNMLSRTLTYLEEVHGHGDLLIEGLRQGKVPQFRNAKTDQLESELRAAQYLDSESPLSRDAIIRALLARSLVEIQQNPREKKTIHVLVDRLSQLLDHDLDFDQV